MKFHRIDISNINSLYGDQPIDIEGELAGSPLYLIMGPTGSGKTTILDAICLALFGTTPRQADADGGAAGVGDQVNSKGTGRSRAAVEFSLLDAKQGTRTRYRAVWEFWRAHDNAYATPQTPRRELLRIDEDGEEHVLVSSTKGKEYDEAFDRVLDGMELQDFLRSVMLAQGEFSALLKADASEKAAILERLTDTGDYKRLGRLAHDRWREERDKLDLLEDRVENFDGASPDEIARTEARLADKRSDYEGLEAWRDATAARRDWLDKQTRLEEERDAAREAQKQAKADREEHAEAFARRDADKKAARARGPLDEVRRLEDELDTLGERIPKLEEACTEKDKAYNDAYEAEQAARAELEDAQADFKELKPRIEEAKKIKADLDNAQKRAAELDNKTTAQRKELGQAKSTVDEARKTLDACETDEKSKADALDEIADDAALAEQLSGLRVELERLEQAEKRVADAADKAGSLADQLDEKSAEKQKLDAGLEEAREEIAPLEEAVERAEATLAEQLGDAERTRDRYEELNNELQDVARRSEALAELESRLAARAELADEHAEARAEVEALDETLEKLRGKRDAAAEQLEIREAKIGRLDHNLLAAELRRELEEGEACPVCGGEEHPRVDDYGQVALDMDELADKQARAELEAEAEGLREQIDALDERLETEAEQHSKLSDKATRLEVKLESLDAELAETAQKIGEPLADADLAGEDAGQTLDAAAEKLEERREDLQRQKDALKAAEDALEAAREALAEGKEGVDALEEKLKELSIAIENTKANKKDAEAKLAAERDERDAARRKLRDAFDDADVEVPVDDDAPDFEAALQAAEARRDAYREAKEALDAARKATAEARNAHEKAEAARNAAAEKLESTEKDLEAASDKADTLESQLSEKLDGEDPDAVEKRHQDALEEKRAEVETLGEARQQAEKALQKAKDELEHATKRRAELGEKLEAAQAELDAAVEAIEGMSSVDEVADALLDTDERERLDALCDGIETALHDAARDLERLHKELAAHADEQPDDFEPADHDVETLQAAQDQLDAALVSYNQQIGALEQEIEQMREKLGKFRDLLAERDAQQDEYDGWKELNDLIGTRNGEAFKEFAQALNLDRIVDRANRRLEELHPRYRLQTRRDPASGLPTLDFEIVDRYHAGKPRSLSTLSGGETFLVSLALALALADQQQIEMPIETLFLDEGFGTLDRDSLQKAMDILNDLHTRAGRTVGVISHVEALKEQIGAQINVEPQQEGRSKVVVRRE